jgi:ADP-ribose pyrophosphatase YjhB (NUDIX family)
MLDSLLDPGRRLLFWFSSKPNRLRVRGARIEVMAFLVTRNPHPSILLAKSVYHDIWMPPQEGVKLNESFIEALHRCLEVECGIDLPPDPKQLARHIHVRSCRFVGIVPLPRERHGERPVADDAPGTALEVVTLKRKAYWMATVVLKSQADISFTADGKEISELRWFSVEDARETIRRTNHPEKAELLLRAMHMCRQDISGGSRPKERERSHDGV